MHSSILITIEAYNSSTMGTRVEKKPTQKQKKKKEKNAWLWSFSLQIIWKLNSFLVDYMTWQQKSHTNTALQQQ